MIAAPPVRPTSPSTSALPPTAPETRSRRGSAWHRFTRHQLALAGAVVLAVLALSALAAPLSPYDPNSTNLLDRFAPPSLQHPMGTDDLGRDEATRVLAGGRVSLTVGLLATLVSIVVGTLVGAFAGYFGGWLDSVLMRFTELVIAFPEMEQLAIRRLLA